MSESVVRIVTDVRPRALVSGTLFEGLLDCYVLKGGRCLVSQRGIIRALRGKTDDNGSGPFNQYLERLPRRFAHLATGTAIEFVRPGGGTAIGRDAKDFVAIIRAYSDAWVAGELHPSQAPFGETSYRLQGLLLDEAITARIHKATGYVEIVSRAEELRLIGRVLLPDGENPEWEEAWTPSLIAAVCRLYRWQYTPGGRIPHQLRSVMAMVYRILYGDVVYAELRRRVPYPCRSFSQQGQMKSRRQLQDDLRIVEAFAQISYGPDDWAHHLRVRFRGAALQLSLIA